MKLVAILKFIYFSPATEETPKEVVEETPAKEEAAADKEVEVVEKNGHKNGEAKNGNGEAKNGDSEAKNGDSEEKNGDSEEKNGKTEEKNGDSNGHTNGDAADKEAPKRKADDSGDAKEEPIPVSAEKIAKLKEAEVEAPKAAAEEEKA